MTETTDVGDRWNRRSILWLLAMLGLAGWAVLAAANLYLGDLNQDEGWYLYAARQWRTGLLPFRDYAFTQGPVLPAVYALATPWVERMGVAGGRLFTALLGLTTILLAGLLAMRLAPRRGRIFAAVLTLLLLGLNVYHSYFTTIVKTYALCGLFLTLGLLAWTWVRSPKGVLASFLTGVFLALAAGVRVSAGVALPVVGVYLLLQRGRLGHRCWIAFGVGGALALAMVFVPFLVMGPESFWFCMVEYHSLREAGSLLQVLTLKLGFLSRFVQAYYVLVLVFVGYVLLRLARGKALAVEPDRRKPAQLGVVWAVGIAVTLVHLIAPFPYDDYQVVVVPLLAAAVAASWARVAVVALPPIEGEEGGAVRVMRAPWAGGLLLMVLLASAAAAVSSPLNQEWFIYGRDRIWWKMKEQTPLRQLERAAARVREWSGTNQVQLLTQDTYLAVEAGLTVPAGLEMGPFSYYPDMTDKKAAAVHVLNRSGLTNLLTTCEAPVAAFSGYGLSIASPGVAELPAEEQAMLWRLVTGRYEIAERFYPFGQAHTELKVLTKKASPVEAAPVDGAP